MGVEQVWHLTRTELLTLMARGSTEALDGFCQHYVGEDLIREALEKALPANPIDWLKGEETPYCQPSWRHNRNMPK